MDLDQAGDTIVPPLFVDSSGGETVLNVFEGRGHELLKAARKDSPCPLELRLIKGQSALIVTESKNEVLGFVSRYV